MDNVYDLLYCYLACDKYHRSNNLEPGMIINRAGLIETEVTIDRLEFLHHCLFAARRG